MGIKQLAAGLVVAALSVSTLALSAPQATAKGVEVRTAGNCTAGTDWKLKAKRDDGRLEVEFEADSNRRGQRWAVRLADNGVTVWSGHRTTAGRSASFSVEKRIANRAGADVITVRATNPRTGEVCRGRLVFNG